jgi:RNA polymerase sigma-32 factor
MEDIVQEGNIGLLKAAERYDPDRGCRLATYAALWIRAEIREHVARGYRIVRLGSSKGERRALRVYRRTREKDPQALAKLSGLSEQQARDLLPLLMARDVSFEHATGDHGTALAERFASDAHTPEEEVCSAYERKRLAAAVQRVVSELGPREQRIVEQRLSADEPQTLKQLGVAFGVSKERVRQLEARAKKRMRGQLAQIVGDVTP